MCTLTWARTADTDSSTSTGGYHIHFNRDESRQRSKATPPQLLISEDVEYLAPIDQDALGTWIFVNSRGFSACLLNNYIDVPASVKKQAKGNRSRGLLVKDLSHVKNVDEGLAQLNQSGIENYSPFDLYLFDKQSTYCVGWNGLDRIDSENPRAFKSSSGFNTEAVIKSRKKYHLISEGSTESLREFHRSHNPDKSAYSTCMHRDDAQTHSYTEISVYRGRASMRYTDGPPCTAPLSEPVSINLK